MRIRICICTFTFTHIHMHTYTHTCLQHHTRLPAPYARSSLISKYWYICILTHTSKHTCMYTHRCLQHHTRLPAPYARSSLISKYWYKPRTFYITMEKRMHIWRESLPRERKKEPRRRLWSVCVRARMYVCVYTCTYMMKMRIHIYTHDKSEYGWRLSDMNIHTYIHIHIHRDSDMNR